MTDIVQLTSELVTNSVNHADGSTLRVAVGAHGGVVHVDVEDNGISGIPHWRSPDPGDENGRGFQIVEELAHRWGFIRDKDAQATVVWFEIGNIVKGR